MRFRSPAGCCSKPTGTRPHPQPQKSPDLLSCTFPGAGSGSKGVGAGEGARPGVAPMKGEVRDPRRVREILVPRRVQSLAAGPRRQSSPLNSGVTAPARGTESHSVFPETLQSRKWGWGEETARPPLRQPLPRDPRPTTPLTSARAPAGGSGVPATHRAARGEAALRTSPTPQVREVETQMEAAPGTRDSPSPARRGDPHGPHPSPRQPRCPPIRSLLRAPRLGIGGGSEGAGVQSRVWGTRPKAEGVVRSRITKLGMLTSSPFFLLPLRLPLSLLKAPILRPVPKMWRGEEVTGNICLEHCGCLSSEAKVNSLNDVQI